MGEIPESDVTKLTPEPSSWLSLRVFYLRLSKCEVNESMLDTLTVTHAPLTADTVLQQATGGERPISSSNGHVTCPLRRDRVDRTSREATFVSTETVRMSGSTRFEVQTGGGERLLVGIMEMCDVADDGCNGVMKGWVMKCQVAAMHRGSGFLKGGGGEGPTIEVYVATLFRGAPVVFTTKAMQLRFRRKRRAPKKAFMEPIPECSEQADQDTKETAPADHKHGPDPEESEYRCYKPDPDYDGLYVRSAGMEGEEDSELSWFTAGVRVGVGISLGICLGVGIGASLLARSYQFTSRSMKRRLISGVL